MSGYFDHGKKASSGWPKLLLATNLVTQLNKLVVITNTMEDLSMGSPDGAKSASWWGCWS